MPPNVIRLEKLGFHLPWSQSGAPTEFLIFPLGPDGDLNIDTEKGRFTFDAKAAETVLTNWQRRGIDLMGDFEHDSLNEEVTGPKPASIKSMSIELRPDGLYANDVKWASDAKQLIDNGQYRYFSPAFKFDKDSKRITMLVNIALTNLPATNQMRPLVAAAQQKDEVVIATSAWREIPDVDDEAAIREHLARHNQVSKEEETTMAEADKTGGKGTSPGGPVTKLGEFVHSKMKEKGIDHEEMAKHLGMGVDSLKKMMACKSEELTSEHHAAMKKMADKIGCKASKLRALAWGDEDEGDEEEKKASPPKKDGDKNVDKNDKADDESASLLSELRGEVTALRAVDKEREELRGEVMKLRAERLDREIDEEIRKAVGEGKLVDRPEQEWARALGKKDIVELRSYLKAVSPKGPASFMEFHAPDKPNEIATLSAAEVAVARMLGQKPEEVAQFKATTFKDGSYPGYRIAEEKSASN